MNLIRLQFVLKALQFAAVPLGASLFEINGSPSDWHLPRLGVLLAFDPNAEPNPNRFRFRIPRSGELLELIPRYRPAEQNSSIAAAILSDDTQFAQPLPARAN